MWQPLLAALAVAVADDPLPPEVAAPAVAAPADPKPVGPEPATPEPSSPPRHPSAGSSEAGAVVREPLRFDFDERRSFSLGAGVGALLERRRFGDPGAGAGGQPRVRDDGGMGDLRVRFVGLAETPARSGRFLWFVLPDLQVSLIFGGRRSSEAAAARGFAGSVGHAGVSGGLASKGRVGVYAKGSLASFWQVAGATEGAYLMAQLGVGAGLRVAFQPDATLLIGPRVDGVIGVHDIAGPRRVTQLAPGADLAVHAGIGYRAYLGVGGGFDVTAAGQAHGGQRMNGRGVVDLAFPLKLDLRLTFFMMYRGMHVTAPPGAQAIDPRGLTLTGHTMMFGVGIGG